MRLLEAPLDEEEVEGIQASLQGKSIQQPGAYRGLESQAALQGCAKDMGPTCFATAVHNISSIQSHDFALEGRFQRWRLSRAPKMQVVSSCYWSTCTMEG